MGIRMPPEPIDFGNDCLTCFAAGKTPSRIYTRFFDMDSCPTAFGRNCKPSPNGRVFVLDQDPISSCQYNYADANWGVHFNFNLLGPHRSVIRLVDTPGFFYFEGTVAGCMEDGHVFANNLVACAFLVCNFVGIAVVAWAEEGYELLEAMVITPSRNLFMEISGKPNGDNIYRFARLRDQTRIHILNEP